MSELRRVVRAALLVAVGFCLAARAGEPNSAVIRHSDIDMLSWYPPGQHTLNPEDFRKWGATLVSWGLDVIFTHTKNVPQPLSELVHAAYEGGVRAYLANLDMCSAQPWNLAKDPALRQAVARDFNGNGLVVPWFPATVDGVPAYWGCLNSPVYRENVRQRVRDGFAAGCKGLHVDCANGMNGILSRHGGCYCRHCMSGFKKYLARKYSRQQLAALGIADLDSWDFAAEVKRVAGTPERLTELVRTRQVDQQLPVFRDYRAFLGESTFEWLKELGRLTKELGGPNAAYSINAGQVSSWLALWSVADFFTCEVRHHPEKGRIPAEVIGKYRAAESLGKILSVTAGTVRDWHYPARGGMDRLVSMWVAFAYANGHLFIVPNNVWCFSPDKGEHAYKGPESVLLPLYRFVRANSRLLDGYQPVEQIGVVYRPGGPAEVVGPDGRRRRKWTDPYSETCAELMEANYPFGVLFPKGGAWQRSLSEQRPERFERIVVLPGTSLSRTDQATLDQWKRSGRAVLWTDVRSAVGSIRPLVSVANGKRLWLLPRRKNDDPSAPLVVHVFNPNYDPPHDRLLTQTNVVVRVQTRLLNGRLQRATWLAPGEQPQLVSFRVSDNAVELTVPQVTLWGILSLECRPERGS